MERKSDEDTPVTHPGDKPGPYDDIAKIICQATVADAVFVVVLNGLQGSGASSAAITPKAQMELAALLERINLQGAAAFQTSHARDIMSRS